MPQLVIDLPCTAGGTSLVFVSCEVQRTGSSNDSIGIRIIRRRSGYADLVLPTAPQPILPSSRDIKAWTFQDVNLPAGGVWSYALQVNRYVGGGIFYAMSLNGVHFRK